MATAVLVWIVNWKLLSVRGFVIPAEAIAMLLK